MESMINDGGFAYPSTAYDKGMTLRDAMAIGVVAGVIQATPNSVSLNQIAEIAYDMADAMLQAREKGEKS